MCKRKLVNLYHRTAEQHLIGFSDLKSSDLCLTMRQNNCHRHVLTQSQ